MTARIELIPVRRDLAEEIAAEAEGALCDAAETLCAEALTTLDRYGIGEGELAHSLSVQADPSSGETLVVASAPHARFVEFGTVNAPARPFLGLALETLRASLTRAVADRLAAVLGRNGPLP